MTTPSPSASPAGPLAASPLPSWPSASLDSLNNRWIAALQAGDAPMVRAMLAMGAHPFDPLDRTGSPERLARTSGSTTTAHPVVRASLWQWAITAPTVEVLDAMVPTIHRTIRRAGAQGKQWMLDGWRQQRWGFQQLLAGAPNPERLRWLVEQTEDWLVGAPGRWSDGLIAPWAVPGDSSTTVRNHAPHHHHPMQRFHREAVLMAVVEAGNAAAWAVPVLNRLWGPAALGEWIDTGEDRAQDLLGLALFDAQHELAAAVVQTGACAQHHRFAMGLASRMLYAGVVDREAALDDHDRGLPRLLGALFDANAPMDGDAPGLTWVPWRQGDGERLEVERWPQVPTLSTHPERGRASPHPSFRNSDGSPKRGTPVLDVLTRWFQHQATAREQDAQNQDLNHGKVRVAGITRDDHRLLLQRWEAAQLRTAIRTAPERSPGVPPLPRAAGTLSPANPVPSGTSAPTVSMRGRARL